MNRQAILIIVRLLNVVSEQLEAFREYPELKKVLRQVNDCVAQINDFLEAQPVEKR